MSDLEVIQDSSALFDLKEFVFQKALVASGVVMILILLGILGTLVVESWPAIVHHGFGFFYKENWDPVFGEFGGLSFLLGTLLTSFLACVIALPFSLAIAIFLGEYFRHGKIAFFLGSAVDVLASIPSVIYGFWGLFVVVPFVRQLEIGLGIIPYGVGIFTAALILAIMIVPYGASLAKEVIQLVPQDLKEAALSLGATPTEVMWKVILPYARSGIFAGQLLALGRALGETMAVTMVIGNANILPTSIFSPSTTMATVIANEFAEATGQLYLSSLIEIGLLLFIVTTVISMIGRLIINRLSLR
ncbi:MAG: phosphate ABC transporter permease subunit PstC [Candidatus Margulisiibacteriota bacterium]